MGAFKPITIWECHQTMGMWISIRTFADMDVQVRACEVQQIDSQQNNQQSQVISTLVSDMHLSL